MTRYFNTEGCCKPGVHYMVRLDTRLKAIKEVFVDRGKILHHQQREAVRQDNNAYGIGGVSERRLFCYCNGFSDDEHCQLCR